MSAREDVKDKVQRILTKNFEVRLGELDDYYIDFGSSAVRITIDEPSFTHEKKRRVGFTIEQDQ